MKNCIKNINPLNNPTWKTLYRADKSIQPFQLSFPDMDELVSETVIRIVPKKRLVTLGRWGDKEVVIKLFYEKKKAAHDCKKDAFGVAALSEANVPTAALLFQGTIDKGRIHVLVFEKIQNAKSIEEKWREKKELTDCIPLLRSATIELATQHVLGIIQKDLHLKNFLVANNCIYTLDGGKLIKCDEPLDKKRSMHYLSLFLAQLGVGVWTLQLELFNVYAKSRGWLIKPADIVLFKKMLFKNNQRRMKQYAKKIFRTCSSFTKIKLWNKSIVYDKYYESPQLVQFLKNPEQFFKTETTEFLKKGRTSTVIKMVLDNQALLVKRYNVKNNWHWIRRFQRLTRAAYSWRASQLIYAFGIATPKPIAFIENHLLGFKGKSYFITEYIPGEHIGDYFSQRKNDEPCLGVAKETLALFDQLKELRMTHGDLKMTNIIISNEHPLVIDLDSIKKHQFHFSLRYSFKHDIKRFMKNWKEIPPIRQLFEKLIG